jgi:hypothetical protein
MKGERYLGNVRKMEVHDLDNEKTAANQCQKAFEQAWLGRRC